jgi:carboxyl-terminal processing protease
MLRRGTIAIRRRATSYSTNSEEASKEEKYYEALKAQYEDIRKKLDADKASALTAERKEIQALIENEICGRYYYLHGKIEKSLTNDPLAIRAIALLSDPDGKYKTLLTKK